MVNVSEPLLYVLDIFALKELMLSLDLIFTGREFHNKIDDVKKVLPPSVFLLLVRYLVLFLWSVLSETMAYKFRFL